jgi:O-antigen chain-terminating methyltransferase
VTHEQEVAFILGELADRAENPLPLARDVRHQILDRLSQASEHANLGGLRTGGRLRQVRQVLNRVLGPTFERQSGYNAELVDAVRQAEVLMTVLEERFRQGWTNIDLRLGQTQQRIEDVNANARDIARSVAAGVSSVEITVAELRQELLQRDQVIAEQRRRIEELAHQQQLDRSDALMQKSRINMFLTEARRRLPDPFDGEQLGAFAGAVETKFEELYEEFERRFRGSRDDIRELQRVYLPDVARLKGSALPLLDIGPGRCEWLELLDKEGISAYGVDSNETITKLARENGLDVRVGDAVVHLEQVGSSTLSAVTAFHVVEHLPFPQLVELLDAALIALEDGGIDCTGAYF